MDPNTSLDSGQGLHQRSLRSHKLDYLPEHAIGKSRWDHQSFRQLLCIHGLVTIHDFEAQWLISLCVDTALLYSTQYHFLACANNMIKRNQLGARALCYWQNNDNKMRVGISFLAISLHFTKVIRASSARALIEQLVPFQVNSKRRERDWTKVS